VIALSGPEPRRLSRWSSFDMVAMSAGAASFPGNLYEDIAEADIMSAFLGQYYAERNRRPRSFRTRRARPNSGKKP
jgi:hypothetical protein